MNMNERGFANIILVAVVAVLIGVGGYFILVKKSELVDQQPVPATTQANTFDTVPALKNETANWKTYTNTQYGFEFKYPTNWYAHPQQNPRGRGISILLLKSEKLPSIEGTEGYAYGDQMLVRAEAISIWNGKLSKMESVSKEDFIQQYFFNEELVKEFNITTKQVVINGKDMLRVEKDTAGASGRELQYVYFKNEMVYSFGLYPYKSEDTSISALAKLTKNYEDFEKLVSTFSFNANLNSNY